MVPWVDEIPRKPWSRLARRIINAYLNDDWLIAIIYGDPRIGKSVYASKVMWEVFQYLGLMDDTAEDRIRILNKYMGWEPSKVIDQWFAITKRIPCFTWDDGGCWLYTLKWADPLLVEVQRYFNVIGTDMNSVLITTPHPEWVLSKIGNMPGAYWVKVIKTRGQDHEIIGRAPPSIRFARRATGYYPFQTPDLRKRRVRKRFVDNYSCHMRDDVYQWYQPIRRFYAKMVKTAMRDKMREIQEKAKKAQEDEIS